MITWRRLAVPGAALLAAACAQHPQGPALVSSHPPAAGLELDLLGTARTGIFADGAAEIPTYDVGTQNLFVVNGAEKTIDVYSLFRPEAPRRRNKIDVTQWGANANSVAAHDGVVAVAVEADTKQDPGVVAFLDARTGMELGAVTVGALPDMVTFTKDGRYVLVANEGEPNDDFDNDPEGSVSIIRMPSDPADVDQGDVETVSFTVLNDMALPYGMRTSNPGTSTVAQDVEPEYIAVSADSRTAWVTLQENNAVAIIDIRSATLTRVVGLGYKNHRLHAMDASNRDDALSLRPWPVWGMKQPDSIASIVAGGQEVVLIANEGDARDYDGYSEEARVADLLLDSSKFPNPAVWRDEANLGRLKVTTAQGDTDGDADYDELYVYGGRSFSVLAADGTLLFDSGSQLETLMAHLLPDDANSDDEENGSFDDRSDDKGPEPEGLATGVVNGVPYAFVGLERIGGIVVYDLSNPAAPRFVSYRNDRDFGGDPAADTAGEMSPEGLLFISAEDSPNGEPLLVVSSEVSGSTAIYALR